MALSGSQVALKNGTAEKLNARELSLSIRRSYSTLFVPTTAVTTDLQRTFVIRVLQGKAEWVDVKAGVTADGKVEVFGPLQAGDLVVRNATDSIRSGTSVSVENK